MSILIKGMSKPKTCDDCIVPLSKCDYLQKRADDCPIIEIDLVRCGECKHRPIKDDPDGADYGFNIVEPTDGDDICPCLVEDGWYSWMPEDNFYCGRGERRADD